MDNTKTAKNPVYSRTDSSKVELTEDSWKKLLTPEVYDIARMKGTERPWSSPFENSKDTGTYYCAVCGNGRLAGLNFKVIAAVSPQKSEFAGTLKIVMYAIDSGYMRVTIM